MPRPATIATIAAALFALGAGGTACVGEPVGEGSGGVDGGGAGSGGSAGAGAGGSGAGPSDTACVDVCTVVENCGGLDMVDCFPVCKGQNWSDACMAAISAADCSEVIKSYAETPVWLDACFPSCTEGASCEGDKQRRCRDGREFLENCEWVCSGTWSGHCGVSYQGAVTSDGLPACWCY